MHTEYWNILQCLIQASHCTKIDPQWTHDYVPLAAPSGIWWHAKDFPKTPEVDADAGETQPEFILCLTMPSWMAHCFHNVFLQSRPNFRIALRCPHKHPEVPNFCIHMSIGNRLQHSVRPALPMRESVPRSSIQLDHRKIS